MKLYDRVVRKSDKEHSNIGTILEVDHMAIEGLHLVTFEGGQCTSHERDLVKIQPDEENTKKEKAPVRDTIDILNESFVARKLLNDFHQKCMEKGIEKDSEEYNKLREFIVLISIYKEPKAMQNEANKLWNYHNGF